MQYSLDQKVRVARKYFKQESDHKAESKISDEGRNPAPLVPAHGDEHGQRKVPVLPNRKKKLQDGSNLIDGVCSIHFFFHPPIIYIYIFMYVCTHVCIDCYLYVAITAAVPVAAQKGHRGPVGLWTLHLDEKQRNWFQCGNFSSQLGKQRKCSMKRISIESHARKREDWGIWDSSISIHLLQENIWSSVIEKIKKEKTKIEKKIGRFYLSQPPSQFQVQPHLNMKLQ